VKVRSKHLRNVNVFLDRRRIAQRKKRSFRVKVVTADLRIGKHRLTVRAIDARKRAARKTAIVRVCG
jgi:hypothetical protein